MTKEELRSLPLGELCDLAIKEAQAEADAALWRDRVLAVAVQFLAERLEKIADDVAGIRRAVEERGRE